eukprot:609494-Amphidinium_carterae.1
MRNDLARVNKAGSQWQRSVFADALRHDGCPGAQHNASVTFVEKALGTKTFVSYSDGSCAFWKAFLGHPESLLR